MKPNNPSYVFITSVVVALITLFFSASASRGGSTGAILTLALIAIYLSPLVIRTRLPHDSALIWGARLFVYAGCAVLGRAPVQSYYYFGSQAFVTMGLILGGELVLQSFREPPAGFKFDPLQLFVSSLLFLVACGTMGPQVGLLSHLWVCAPVWMFLTLLAMGDTREDAVRLGTGARLRQFGLLSIAVCGGFLAHSALSNNHNSIMSLGARLLSETDVKVSEAGVADAPSMSSGFNTNASTSRLLRIEGTLGDSHLRAGAFAEYRQGTWGPPLSELSSRPITDALPDDTLEEKRETMTLEQIERDPKRGIDSRTDYNAKITVLRDSGQIMFAPLNASALIPLGIGFDWNRFAGPLKSSDPTPLSYGIVDSRTDISGVQTEQGPLCVSLYPTRPDPKNYRPDQQPKLKRDRDAFPEQRAFAEQERPKLVEVPREIERGVVDLAHKIERDAGAKTPTQKIQAVSEYLLRNYKYSLKFQRTDRDPVSDFLLNKKSAHCQYFAAASVMLLRSMGVPSRYATGFWAHETAPDGTTTVRGRDAHAWCESWVENVGWVNVEATPPSGRADPQANPLSWWQQQQEKLEDSWAKVRNWFGNLSSLQIGGIMLGILGLWGLERWRQARKRARSAPQKPMPPLELQPLARGFEKALQKRGITLLDGQTWSEVVPPEWNAGQDFVEGYNAARFQPRDENQLRDLTTKLRAMQKK